MVKIERDTYYSYNRVMNFLDGAGESTTNGEDAQRRTMTCFNAICRETALPEGVMSFDRKGEMVLAMTKKDADAFKRFMFERKAIVNDLCAEQDNALKDVPWPSMPGFFYKDGSKLFKLFKEEGEDALLAELDEKQTRQYTIYAAWDKRYKDEIAVTLGKLKPLRAAWKKENAQFNFTSEQETTSVQETANLGVLGSAVEKVKGWLPGFDI